MQFAVALPWWMLALLAIGIGAVAWGCYAGAVVPLTRRRRVTLSTLRALTLLFLIACLLRPIRVVPSDAANNAVVPVLIDASRSMSLADMNGRARIDVARDLLQDRLRPALQTRFQTDVWTFGQSLEPVTGDVFSATAGRSDLSGALRALRERYRDRRVAGVVVLSDGGDTESATAKTDVEDEAIPVYAIGIGAPRVSTDFEVLDVSAGELSLADSSIDLTVTAVHRGSEAPFDVRVLENGRPVDLRSLVPVADGSPVRAVFTVAPSREAATLYTVEIPSASGELVVDNNRRSVLVEPPGRRRRILMIEGAPGFEHSFIKRALAADQGIELDSVVRKGQDSQGAATYFVQATEARAKKLVIGFPQDRAALYQYDAVILANVEPDTLSRPQLQMMADFVDQRGGGVLVLGAKSFFQEGFSGTALEDVLPVRLTDRGRGVVRASARAEMRFAITVTPEGQSHPVMRIGGASEDLAKRWAAVPPLSGASAFGTLRPGAQALALVHTAEGPRPLVAVQRYGRGRSMVFAGEASWRWRMQMPSTDRTHELFWRQAARWIAAGAPDAVSIAPPSSIVPGGPGSIVVEVRDQEFTAQSDARVTMQVTLPDGTTTDVRATLADPETGRYSGDVRFDEPGVYHVVATAERGSDPPNRSERWILAGGADLEMADPRLNEEVLRRIAVASGGSYLAAGEIGSVPALLESQVQTPAAELQELWHNVWIFAGVMIFLAAEWTLRRRWGLR